MSKKHVSLVMILITALFVSFQTFTMDMFGEVNPKLKSEMIESLELRIQVLADVIEENAYRRLSYT